MPARSDGQLDWRRLVALAGIAAAWNIASGNVAAAADTPLDRGVCVNMAAPDRGDRTSTALGPRIKRANALIDQGCYKDAVAVLEAAASLYPNNAEVAGKLRDVRSILTEDTYIKDVTQAEDAASLEHSQLRCKKFGDLEACNASLKATPNDTALLTAKADALLQGGHAKDAVAVYARATQLKPGDDLLKAKLAEAQRQNAPPLSPAAPPVPAVPQTPPAAPGHLNAAVTIRSHETRSRVKDVIAKSTPQLAAATPAVPETANAAVYSNAAPSGRSN